VACIKYGDDCTNFFARAKQRKLATYIYAIKDGDNRSVEGFEQVGQVMLGFYKKLLGPLSCIRRPFDLEVINLGLVLTREQQLSSCTPFSDKDIHNAMFLSQTLNQRVQMALVVAFLKPPGAL